MVTALSHLAVTSNSRASHQLATNSSESGFTLLEVLVALGILGMSLTVLLGSFSFILYRTRQAQRQSEATTLAQSLMASAIAAAPENVRSQSGETETGLRWRIQVGNFGATDDRLNWQAKPVRILSEVHWSDHGDDHSTSIATLRLIPKDTTR